MHKMFPIGNKPCLVPSILLVLNVVVPESIIIVIVVDW